jgi:hypothetical protein
MKFSWAAFEAQIPTEVLRQDQSRSPVHHEGAARKAALSLPWRNVHRAQDEAWSRPDRRSTATALVFGHANIGLCHDFGVRPPDARTRVQLAKVRGISTTSALATRASPLGPGPGGPADQ